MKIDQILIKEFDYNSICWKCRKYKHACAKSDSITQSLGTRDQNIAVPRVRWDRHKSFAGSSASRWMHNGKFFVRIVRISHMIDGRSVCGWNSTFSTFVVSASRRQPFFLILFSIFCVFFLY